MRLMLMLHYLARGCAVKHICAEAAVRTDLGVCVVIMTSKPMQG